MAASTQLGSLYLAPKGNVNSWLRAQIYDPHYHYTIIYLYVQLYGHIVTLANSVPNSILGFIIIMEVLPCFTKVIYWFVIL